MSPVGRSLEFLRAFDRPEGLRNYQWRIYAAADRSRVGLLAGRSLRTFACGAGFEERSAFPLQEVTELAVAFHPRSDDIVIATPERVELREADGGRRELSGLVDGQPRGVCFDPSGDLLWITFEDARGRNHVAALEPASLRRIGVVAVPGEADSYHNLHAHPVPPVLAVEVSCGQDGTWLSFVEHTREGLVLLPRCIERPGDPFCLAGFAPDGRRFATVDLQRVQLREWPGCAVVEEVGPPRGQLFDWSSSYVGDQIAAVSISEADDSYHVLLFDGDLELESAHAWNSGDQRSLFDVQGLPGERLLLLGDLRAGLFQLKGTDPSLL